MDTKIKHLPVCYGFIRSSQKVILFSTILYGIGAGSIEGIQAFVIDFSHLIYYCVS